MIEVKIVEQSVRCLTKYEEYSRFPGLIEEYARICFQSEGHIGEDFVRRIMANQHESVLEHFSLSFSITTDRAIANALVRHRHCAFTQESTHYIGYAKKGKAEYVRQGGLSDGELTAVVNDMFKTYEAVYGLHGKDAARGFLPLGLKTELRMTTNLREWRHIMRLRGAFDHPQMLQLIRLLHDWFRGNLPLFVEDIKVR